MLYEVPGTSVVPVERCRLLPAAAPMESLCMDGIVDQRGSSVRSSYYGGP